MTRRQAVVGAAPVLIGLAPLANAALADSSSDTDGMPGMDGQMAEHHVGVAARLDDRRGGAGARRAGSRADAPGGYEPGPVRTYDVVATEQQIEVAKGVFFPAWAYGLKDGPATVPGPTIRVTEGQTLRVNFTNGSSHPHTIHFHGIHPADMDGVFEIVEPGGASSTSSRPGPPGCTCTTATRRRSRSTSRRVFTAR